MTFEAQRISVALAGRTVLAEIDLSLAPGQLIAVVGPNGAGKSTLLKTLTGAIAPRSGQVLFDGRPLAAWPQRELAARRAVLAQSQHVAFPFTVFEVVALGRVSGAVYRSAAIRRLVLDSLAAVDLAGYEGRLFQHLSGGEQQRVHIARALCQIGGAGEGKMSARWLFLDEPTQSLDVTHQLAILDAARRHADAGGGAFAILHDLNLASLYADRLILVESGRIAGDGPPAETLSKARVRAVFGDCISVHEGRADGRPYVLPAGLAA